MSKNTILVGLIWVGLATWLYCIIDRQLMPNKVEKLGNEATVTLERGRDGHYRAEAWLNEQKIDVLVDTGATDVAISERVANQLNLSRDYPITTNTANGEAQGFATRLKTVKLGGVIAHDVSAIIAPGLNGDVLLGMSFLSRMDVRLFQGKMTVKQVEEK